MEEQVRFYASEADKIIKYLNHKKEEGLIITSLELVDGLGKAVFEETDKDFIYSLDYSKFYPEKPIFLNQNYEYFDNAKKDGWVFQCYIEGMGIWINENKDAPLFLLDEEYQEICNNEWQKRKKYFIYSTIYYLVLLLLEIVVFIVYGRNSVFYSLPFALFYGYTVFTTVTKQKNYPKAVIDFYAIIYIASMWLLTSFNLFVSLALEGIYILICCDLLQDDSIVIKFPVLRKMVKISVMIIFILGVFFGK